MCVHVPCSFNMATAKLPSTTPTTNYVLRPRSLSRKLLHYSLHLPTLTKALILLAIVLVGSTIYALDLSPESAFSDRHNPVNVYLVKYSWGWTLLIITPAAILSSSLYNGLNITNIFRHLSRLVVSHVIWFSVTSLIVLLDSSVGSCAVNEVTGRHECLKKGHLWLGFDISGHVFLLTYCIYVISEECANIKLEIWYEFPEFLSHENAVTNKLSQNTKDTLLLIHQISSWIIEPLELLCLALVLVWAVMVVSTSLYFHTFAEKVLGYLCALLSWHCTYNWLYGRSKYLPCRPDDGYLHPLRAL